MKNRPDKPGLYWWEDDCGRYHVAEFDEEMETLDSCDTGFVSPEKFEDSVCFIRWVGPAQPPPTVREPVSWFAQQMESKLIKNDHKVGWRHMTYRDLQRRIKDELEELYKAIFGGEGSVISEAADVANFCMMIADNWRHQNNG